MLVIGISPDKTIVNKDLDVDPDIDSPRKIHDKLKDESKHNQDFDIVICVEDEEVKGSFVSGEDYDLTEDPSDDDTSTDTDEDDFDDDKLNDDGDDFNDEDDDVE